MREWFTARELAGLPGMPKAERVILIWANAGRLIRRPRDKGKGYEYAFASLPPDTQAALLLRAQPSAPAADPVREAGAFTYDPQALWSWWEKQPERQRARGAHRLKLIDMALLLTANGTPQRKAFEIVGRTAGVPWRSIERWYQGDQHRAGCRRYARADWAAALTPGWSGRRPDHECTPDAWAFFCADYLRLEQPGARACYERLQRAASAHGWTVPSLRTLERRVLREIPHTRRVLMREGEEKLMALFPAQQRTVRDLHAGQWINGDGYEHNVIVRWPDGTLDRPRTWFWQDVYSRKILAFRTDQTENADLVRAAFADVLLLGVPDHVTIDNTRAAANKWMTGRVANRYRFKTREDDPLGIFPMFGVQVHWTSVHNGRGHGQAKPVERAFGVGGIGEYVDKHPAFAGAWTGPHPTAKPENYGSHAVPLATFLQVLADEIAAWNARPSRRTEMCHGELSFDAAFAASYARAPIRKATAEQRRICLLCAEAVPVKRDGTIVLEAGAVAGGGRNRYGARALLEHIGQKVVVRFDPQDLHETVAVYTLDGRFIAEAPCEEAAGYGDTETARVHTRARKQFLKHTKLAAEAEHRMTAGDVAALLPSTAPAVVPDAKVVQPFRPAARIPVTLDAEQEAEVVDFLARQEARDDTPHDVRSVPRSGGARDLYAYWQWCKARVASGAVLPERDQAFFEGFPRTQDYAFGAGMFADFDLDYRELLPEWAKKELLAAAHESASKEASA